MNTTLIGLDLAKNVFHAVELDQHGKPHWRKKFSRTQLLRHFGNHSPAHIAMEACASAHHWARSFIAQGHTVSLFPPKHVKAYVRGQKNDYNDAQAIAEAAFHGALRPVPVKTVAQQNEQALHRMRSQCVGERTRVVNQLRGLLAEYGLVIPAGSTAVRKALPVILSDADNGLTDAFRELLHRQYQRLVALDEETHWYAARLQQHSKQDEICRRLQDIPGFGPVVSSAVKCWMGDGRQFHRGRDASAALGLVPRQCSSGDKERLLGITKRGDTYTRTQVIHGARSVVIHAARKTDALSRWINRLVETRGFNKAAVALANKLIRIAWVVIARGECYRPREVLAQG